MEESHDPKERLTPISSGNGSPLEIFEKYFSFRGLSRGFTHIYSPLGCSCFVDIESKVGRKDTAFSLAKLGPLRMESPSLSFCVYLLFSS